MAKVKKKRKVKKSNYKRHTGKPVDSKWNNYVDESSGKRYMICQNSEEGGKYWKGQHCSSWTEVAHDVVASLCWKCSYAITPFHETVRIIPPKSDKPRGWKFMKLYVHKDGTVYHKGVEQPDLKGTLEPTPPKEKKPVVKLTKGQKVAARGRLGKEIASLKRALKKETRKTYARKLESQIKKKQRDLKKIR